ncbi:uncharacterized protein LOC126904095 [Daktulosphaira vitifoliae]|uniref:uncharacterized protein LOC126904095 n=1 Tax=Daktulosphaira vitifoliae TaxID=58002 RepID=UPI0021AAAD52|nr:uncharacterized protein LOC126904095 [Daktulosphaira vitifoliae]XP_050538774.1 uncharacterized protein LOC126904095 [Daktulosphaira vitifoliae]
MPQSIYDQSPSNLEQFFTFIKTVICPCLYYRKKTADIMSTYDCNYSAHKIQVCNCCNSTLKPKQHYSNKIQPNKEVCCNNSKLKHSESLSCNKRKGNHVKVRPMSNNIYASHNNTSHVKRQLCQQSLPRRDELCKCCHSVTKKSFECRPNQVKVCKKNIPKKKTFFDKIFYAEKTCCKRNKMTNVHLINRRPIRVNC